MIINLDYGNESELKALGSFTLVDGSFDPIHHGHISYFTEATRFALPLVCLIAPDSYTSKKHKIMLPAPERAQVLDSLIQISAVVYGEVKTGFALQRLLPLIYFKGGDWRGKLPNEIVEVCQEIGCRIEFGAPPIASSSKLIANIRS